jgi:hypothetical protein
MDRRTALDTQAAPATQSTPRRIAVEADQAVFTSIASPMGRGYRLVAASPGVSADERRELVQRAPSHGNLCDPGQNGVGTASFQLSSGRRCIMVSWHAEQEHSNRGGFRVHTQFAILGPLECREIAEDPLAIDAAIRTGVDSRKIPAAEARLPRLALSVVPGDAAGGVVIAPADAGGWADRIAAVASALLNNRRALVVNAPHANHVLRLTFAMLPPPVRRSVTLAVGMRYSPSRNFQLVLTQARREELERIVCDQPYDVIDWNGPIAPPACGQHEQWVRVAREMLSTQRVAELTSVSDQFAGEDYQSALAKISQLVEDLARMDKVNLDELKTMMARHLPFKRINDFQTNLHLKFVTESTLRMRQLTRHIEPSAD